jgi:hypothetical protein
MFSISIVIEAFEVVVVILSLEPRARLSEAV